MSCINGQAIDSCLLFGCWLFTKTHPISIATPCSILMMRICNPSKKNASTIMFSFVLTLCAVLF